MKNLIFSRRHDDGILTPLEVEARAPAVYTLGHAETLSARYGEVSTARAIEILDGHGWKPTQAAQKRARSVAGRGYAEHLIAFGMPGGFDGPPSVNERPEVILYNSHDGSSSLRLFVGFYRFICSNGIVAGEGFEARIRHSVGTVAGFETMLGETVERIPAMLEAVNRLRAVSLTPAGIREAGERAARLRWEAEPARGEFGQHTATGAYYTPETVHGLIQPRRWGDEGTDAWTVLNRIQEGVIRGRVLIRSVTEAKPYGADRKAKAVSSVSETVRLNRAVWDTVAEVAGIDTGALVAA
jgi:hypothetical protein